MADITEQTDRVLKRLLPRIVPVLQGDEDAGVFLARLRRQFPKILTLLHGLYGDRIDFFYDLEQVLLTAARMFVGRSAALRALDKQREAEPQWFQSEHMVGGVCYVDLFADNLAGLQEKIPYFKELGLTYLHLMPLFKSPEKENDGGYAVSDYRTVDPKLGTMEELAALSEALRAEGISLVLDFVFNHTSDEHEWAQRARAGEAEYRDFYFIFDDRTLPDQYEQHLREIFPMQDPGNFTYVAEMGKWVWTTFRHFQWDLNYRNPAVFNAMLEEMLFLANQGVEVLRLDAVAFIWKEMGTSCENLPQAHQIIQAYNALMKIVAPALLFKSEAIVHPADVQRYVSWDEAPLSYNPTLMALLWESLATRNVKLLTRSMQKRFTLPKECAWVNYVRVHDDIGWTFADEDAQELGINPKDHRMFLNKFYTGRFEGSFAAGLPFNYNPQNQDVRISGTTASLAGLERALESGDEEAIDKALKRIWLIHSVIISAGGIPLLYLGDEIATLNDYSYRNDPRKADDSRWVHRPRFDWERAEKRLDPESVEGRVFAGMKYLLDLRKRLPAMANGGTMFFDTGDEHVLGYIRNRKVMVLANFSEEAVKVSPQESFALSVPKGMATDLITDTQVDIRTPIALEPLQFMWLI